MKRKLICILMLLFCLSLLTLTMKAQQKSDPDEIENQIIQLEAQNIDEMSSSVRKLIWENLIELYRQYIDSAGNQIALIEKIPDPQGKFKKKRDEYINKRAQIQNRLNQTLRNLGVGQMQKPMESQLVPDKPSRKISNSP